MRKGEPDEGPPTSPVGKTPKYKMTGNATDEQKEWLAQEIDALPSWLTNNVDSVELNQGRGYTFQAGGQTFTAGADWDLTTRQIRLWDAHRAGSGFASLDKEIRDSLSHESGHAFFDQWWAKADIEDVKVKTNQGWLDVGGYVKPEHRDKVPFLAARDDFMAAWSRGEDGLTAYSRAWAKESWQSGTTEAVAAMMEKYISGGRSALLRQASRAKAKGLGRALLDAIKAAEAIW